MQVTIAKDGNEVYNGEYDLIAMTQAMGAECKEECKAVEAEFSVTVDAREGEALAAAKLINYAHAALVKQGVTTDLSYVELRKLLTGKPEEVKGPWQFVFKNSDDALFFISVIHHTDILKAPKWQVWYTDEDDVQEGMQKFDADHFVKHYLQKISRNYLAQLTQTSPDSDACKTLDGIRLRVGKALGVIRSARTHVTDEEKQRRLIEKIKEDDRNLLPDEFSKVQSGEMTIQEFKAAVVAKKKEAKAAERAAKKAASGKKATVTKVLDDAGKDRIAKAREEIARKKEQNAPAAEAEA